MTVWTRRWFELTMNALTSFEDQGRPMKGKVSFRGIPNPLFFLASPHTPCFAPFTHPPTTHPPTYLSAASWA